MIVYKNQDGVVVAPIYQADGRNVRMIAPVMTGAKVVFSLMKSDYIEIKFTSPKYVEFQMGDFIDTAPDENSIRAFGLEPSEYLIDQTLRESGVLHRFYEITETYSPQYSKASGGWTYTLQFKAYYYHWNNKLFMLPTTRVEEDDNGTPRKDADGNPIVTYHRRELSWNFTGKLEQHCELLLYNLKALGYKYRTSLDVSNDTEYTVDIQLYSNRGATVTKDGVTVAGGEGLVYIEDTVKAISYDKTGLLDALYTMAKQYDCDCWVTGSVIHFGKCEFPQADIPVIRNGLEAADIKTNKGGKFATRLWVFGSTQNIPDTYRKHLVFFCSPETGVSRETALLAAVNDKGKALTEQEKDAIVYNYDLTDVENGEAFVDITDASRKIMYTYFRALDWEKGEGKVFFPIGIYQQYKNFKENEYVPSYVGDNYFPSIDRVKNDWISREEIRDNNGNVVKYRANYLMSYILLVDVSGGKYGTSCGEINNGLYFIETAAYKVYDKDDKTLLESHGFIDRPNIEDLAYYCTPSSNAGIKGCEFPPNPADRSENFNELYIFCKLHENAGFAELSCLREKWKKNYGLSYRRMYWRGTVVSKPTQIRIPKYLKDKPIRGKVNLNVEARLAYLELDYANSLAETEAEVEKYFEKILKDAGLTSEDPDIKQHAQVLEAKAQEYRDAKTDADRERITKEIENEVKGSKAEEKIGKFIELHPEVIALNNYICRHGVESVSSAVVFSQEDEDDDTVAPYKVQITEMVKKIQSDYLSPTIQVFLERRKKQVKTEEEETADYEKQIQSPTTEGWQVVGGNEWTSIPQFLEAMGRLKRDEKGNLVELVRNNYNNEDIISLQKDFDHPNSYSIYSIETDYHGTKSQINKQMAEDNATIGGSPFHTVLGFGGACAIGAEIGAGVGVGSAAVGLVPGFALGPIFGSVCMVVGLGIAALVNWFRKKKKYHIYQVKTVMNNNSYYYYRHINSIPLDTVQEFNFHDDEEMRVRVVVRDRNIFFDIPKGSIDIDLQGIRSNCDIVTASGENKGKTCKGVLNYWCEFPNSENAMRLLVDRNTNPETNERHIPTEGEKYTITNIIESKVPAYYFTSDEDYCVIDDVIDARLKLPNHPVAADTEHGYTPYTGEGYIDAYEGMTEADIIEETATFEDIYPHRVTAIKKLVEKYVAKDDERVDQNTGDKYYKGWTYYRYQMNAAKEVRSTGQYEYDPDAPVAKFSKRYILEQGGKLNITFQSGKLNGLTFEVTFNPDAVAGDGVHYDETTDNESEERAEMQIWEIVVNENYGRRLPSNDMHPEEGDLFVLYGYDPGYMWDTGKESRTIVEEAEEKLLRYGREYLDKAKRNSLTYTASLQPAWAQCRLSFDADGTEVTTTQEPADRILKLGQLATLRVDTAISKEPRYRTLRVQGYEIKLDKPYDNPQYTFGEMVSYSRLGNIDNQISALTANQNILNKGGVITGSGTGGKGTGGTGGTGGGVSLIKTGEATTPSDTNVYTAKRSDRNYLSKTKDDSTPHALGAGSLTVDTTMGVNEDENTTAIIARYGAVIDDFMNGRGTLLTGNGRMQLDRLEVRKSMTVMELIINQLHAMDGDYYFSDAGTIEEVTPVAEGRYMPATADSITSFNDDGEPIYSYGLYRVYDLKLKKDVDKAALKFRKGDILLSVISNLGEKGVGSVNYYQSWMRVLTTDPETYTIRVELFTAEECGVETVYAPQAGFNIVRRGNVDSTHYGKYEEKGDVYDPYTKEVIAQKGNSDEWVEDRQSAWNISSRDGAITYYGDVDSPKFDLSQLKILLGKFPDYGTGPMQPYAGQYGLYAQTILAGTIQQIDWAGNVLHHYIDHGEWAQAQADAGSYVYFKKVETDTDASGARHWTCITQSRVFHKGFRWACLTNKTREEPAWNALTWQLIEGGSEDNFVLDFESNNGYTFYVDAVDVVVTAHLYFNGQDITAEALQSSDIVWQWKRDSGDETEDNGWHKTDEDSLNSKNQIHLIDKPDIRHDLGSQWATTMACSFILTVTINRQGTTQTVTNTINVNL